MSPHNPALPDERRRLAIEALRAGTALHLPDPLAWWAEHDADYLVLVHGSPRRVLNLIDRKETSL